MWSLNQRIKGLCRLPNSPSTSVCPFGVVVLFLLLTQPTLISHSISAALDACYSLCSHPSSLFCLLSLVLTPRTTGMCPALPGECSYDLTTNGTASGTVTIWGSSSAISDITTAADWEIVECDPHATTQTIRLVCKSENSANCNHLYGGHGAVNKIVRLPEHCGPNAFARISSASIPTNQTIPASVEGKLSRRNGWRPQVKSLTLDTNFAAVDHSKTGVINIAIQAANVPGVESSAPLTRRSTVPSRFSRRGFLSSIGHAISSAAGSVGNAVSSAASSVGNDVSSAASSVGNAISSATSVSDDKTFTLSPVSLSKSITLLDESVTCGDVTAKLSASLDAVAQATASIGVVASGTLIPPELKEFGIISSLTGSVSGTLDLSADVAGSVDSGSISLLNLGIPGLDIPGVLTIGPSFQVNAELTGSFDVNLDMSVGLNIDIQNAQIAFPPGSAANPAASAFSIGDAPLSLSASPSITATGTLAAHLIPSLNFGISAFDNTASATIYVNVDTSASLLLSLEAVASAGTTTTLGAASSAAKATTTTTVGTSSGKLIGTTISSGAKGATTSSSSSPLGGTSTSTHGIIDSSSSPIRDSGSSTSPGQPGTTTSSPLGGTTTSTHPTIESTSSIPVGGTSSGSKGTSTSSYTTSTHPTIETSSSSSIEGSTGFVGTTSSSSVTSTHSTVESSSSSSIGGSTGFVGTTTSSSATSTVSSASSSFASSIVSTSSLPSQVLIGVNDTSTSHVNSATSVVTSSSARTTSTGVSSFVNATSTGTANSTGIANVTSVVSSATSKTATSSLTTITPTTFVSSSPSGTITSAPTSTLNPAGAPNALASLEQELASIILVAEEELQVLDADLTRRGVSASFGGCFEVDAGININVGASGSFFGLFSDTVNDSLFSKTFVIYKKCFGSTPTTRRSLAALSKLDRHSGHFDRRSLSCPASNAGAPASVVDETVPSSSIDAA
ncbi:hypothetical protein HMN09_00304100 [Mycena chlorophos]|uniref:Uncharacterized protein n=1 Tax=Mycena chlorophos TaxID=658473 RepID=A0A8H6WJ92_MYCCL|nr:hypothetical protein HMN09_00304100 [Mycena chlorophos]